MLSHEVIEHSFRMNSGNPGPQTMATTHHVPPTGRQARPRRKSLEQLEAKYKALMRNMLMYQQMRKRNMGGGSTAGTGTATNIKTEPGTTGRVDEKAQQQHLMFQARQTLPTPSSSVSPSSSTTNLEDPSNSTQNQGQQQPTPQHHHQVPTSALREHQRERPPQKRLQNSINSPKPAYDRRETGSSTRHTRPAGRPMPAAIQLAYDELASMQRQQTPQPPQPQQHQQFQFRQQQQQQLPAQQPAQQSAPILIPRPANIQIPPHYLQQPYMHHLHAHHQPLASPLPTPPHLTTPYTARHDVQTMPAPYASYDASGMPPHMDQQQQHHAHQQQQRGMSSYDHTGNVEGDLLNCFVSNMNEI